MYDWISWLSKYFRGRGRQIRNSFLVLSMGQIQSHYESFDIVTNIKEREEGENITVKARGRRGRLKEIGREIVRI